MLRIALKSVRHNPKRLILTAIAVALGVSLVSATLTFTNALSSGFTGLFGEIYGETDVIVELDPGAEGSGGDPFELPEAAFTEDELDAVLGVDGVARAAGSVQVAGSILPAEPGDTDPFAAGGPSQLFNWTGVPEIDRTTVIDGRAPETAGEIVLDIDSAPRLGYEIGDSVSIATAAGVDRFELVGTVRFGESNQLQSASLGMMTLADAHRLADTDGYQQLSVIADEGADPEAVAEEIQNVLDEGKRAVTGQQKAAEQAAMLDDALQYVDILAIAFALIALFVGGYLIVNTFRVIVTQRTREFGLMRAIGVTGRQVRGMILLEATAIAVVASTIGIVLGYLLALAVAAFVSIFAGDIFGTFTLPLDAVLWCYVLGGLVTLVSAVLPAIHASRISPMEALRESATSGKKSLTSRNIVGAAMVLVGIIVTALGLQGNLDRPYIYVGVGAVLLVLGVTLLSAQVLVPMAYGLRHVLTRLFGVDGKLAANNIRREPRRSANTAAALMIGVMLLALVATFTESLKTVVTSQFQQTHAELFAMAMSPDGIMPPGAVDVIADVDGVEIVSRMGYGRVDYDGENLYLAVVETDSIDEVFTLNTEPSASQIGDGVFVDATMADRGVSVGDEVTLGGSEATLTLEVTGEYLTSGDAEFWVGWDTAERLLGTVEFGQALILLGDDVDVDEAQSAIQDALAEQYPLVMIEQPGQLEQFANQFIDLILGFISALLGAALLIAILGVANTLLLSVTERTREIGLLRAVGLRRGSVWRMITLESVVMAIFGTVMGMLLGVSLGSALVLALAEFGFESVTIPWVLLVVYTVLAAIAGVVAAIWPAWRASRLNILEAIASDG